MPGYLVYGSGLNMLPRRMQRSDAISSFNSSAVNFEELARCTDDFNGAQCKAVCVEAVSTWYSCHSRHRMSAPGGTRKRTTSLMTRNALSFQGMIALRRNGTELAHEDYMDAILEVQAKKKANLNYYA